MSELSASMSGNYQWSPRRRRGDAGTVDAALAAARGIAVGMFPGTRADEIVLDGPESRILNLPTRKVATSGRWTATRSICPPCAGQPADHPILARPVGVRKMAGSGRATTRRSLW